MIKVRISNLPIKEIKAAPQIGFKFKSDTKTNTIIFLRYVGHMGLRDAFNLVNSLIIAGIDGLDMYSTKRKIESIRKFAKKRELNVVVRTI